MYIRNGQPFDIHQRHEIDGVHYPAEWFGVPEHLETLAIYKVTDLAPPAVEANQIAEQEGYEQVVGGGWRARWRVRAKNLGEMAQDAEALKAAKVVKAAEINAAWDKANGTSFIYKGKAVRCDASSTIDIFGTATNILLLGAFPDGFPGVWKYMDDSYEAMPTIEDFKPLYAAFTQAGVGNFVHAQTLKDRVAAATSLAELDAISW